MPDLSIEDLHGYLDEALTAEDAARVEMALRSSTALRQALANIMAERDRGEHTVGAIWRRNRLSCPTREQIGSYLLGVLDDASQDYIEFHLATIGCSFCQANLHDLQERQKEPTAQTKKRQKKLYESSAGVLQTGRKRK